MRFIAKVAVIVTFIALSASCRPNDITQIQTEDTPNDWIVIEAGAAFALRAPTGTAFFPAEGIDSFVGSIRGPEFLMDFDFGYYSNSLSGDSGVYPPSAEWIIADGRRAVILVSDTLQTEPGCSTGPSEATSNPYYFVGMHVPDVGVKRTILERILRLGDMLRRPEKLTIYGCVSNRGHIEIVKKIFRTITF